MSNEIRDVVLTGDCLVKLKELPDNSVDSVVTDPPYHLVSIVKRFGKEGSAPAQTGKDGSFKRLSSGFMGKTWDGVDENGIGIAYNKEMWKECLRVLKPGGHLLAFGGTRTYHRMAVAIEDVGFEIRDMIEWFYGSGFPKSLNIAKQLDKVPYIKDRVAIKEYLAKNINKCSKTKKQINEECGFMACSYTRISYRDDDGWGSALPTIEKWAKMKEVIGFDNKWDEFIKQNERKIIGKGQAGFLEKNDVFELDNKGYGSFDLTKGTSEWEGWGTALKPAHEPICMARKPLGEKTVAENCLKWGTGGINIDESRIGTEEMKARPSGKSSRAYQSEETTTAGGMGEDKIGRFPANLIHDGSDEVRECFPETKSGSGVKNPKTSNIYGGNAMLKSKTMGSGEYLEGDSGNASRFFKSIIYIPKASKSERNKGCEELEEKKTGHGNLQNCEGFERFDTSNRNNHPTVKPVKLMEYLIKMVTPRGGVVLDPFAGSGTTLVSAKMNGFGYIGIELTEEYIPIIKARLKSVDSNSTGVNYLKYNKNFTSIEISKEYCEIAYKRLKEKQTTLDISNKKTNGDKE